LTQPIGLSANITPKPITVTATGIDKTYDGTAAASVTLGSSGLVGSDSVSFTDTSATFSDKNVGSNKTVTVQGIAASGSDATNYSLGNTAATTTASITPATLTVNGTTVAGKVYDGTTAASLSSGSLAGIIGSDAVTLNQTGTFASKNVGNAIAVTAADTLTGTDAGNYTLTQPTGLSASITPKPITVTATGIDKTYDGTTAASVTLGSSGLVGSDSVSFTDTSATFSDKNVGTNKTVTVQGIAASGTDAGNYSLGNTSATTTASIMASTPYALTTGSGTSGNGRASAYISALPNFTVNSVLGSSLSFSASAVPQLTPAASSAPPTPPVTNPSPSAEAPTSPAVAVQPTSSGSTMNQSADSKPPATASMIVLLPNRNGQPLLAVINNGVNTPENQP
ncbi:MAG: hypothetical protein KGM83_07325, partial [Betaproteobacteria bacterium]|nr:hypothetical protein [Betaproteobacteria bacterium]